VETRVETGEGKSGRIFFTLPGDRQDALRSLNYKVAIAFHDFLGKPTSSIFVPSPKPVTGVSTYHGEKGEIIPNVNVASVTAQNLDKR